ncbi:MAG: c-type cytochrome biogenesis protein CcsB [candidate division NC10 bacterium]|nr:c-type cytochrome biogenesis protein CcsB [candidate division NC10 bacterium]
MSFSHLAGASIVLYLLASVAYISHAAMRASLLARGASLLTGLGFLVQTTAIAWRTATSYRLGMGHPPFSNLYESMVFFSWCIALVYLLFEWRTKQKIFGAFVIPFALLTSAYSALLDSEIVPLIPALKSNWLLIHVSVSFLAYGAFALSCGISIAYLIKVRQEKGQTGSGLAGLLPPSQLLDEYGYKGVAVGFPLLTLGILTGAIWAHYAWGSYWSWDPKETWSLIVWLVYAGFLHARIVAGWRGKRTAILSILGFAGVIFLYLGVNYLLSGLHSYN